MTGSKSSEALAEEVWRKSGSRIPVDVYAIALAEGIVVMDDDLQDNISGVLFAESDPVIIGVNRRHHHNRKRFSIAHELGHFVQHRNVSKLFIDVFLRDERSSEGVDSQETEANAFAAALLMPKEAIFKYLHEYPTDPHDEVGIRRMAARFGVSTQAMIIRLTRLNLV